MGEKDNWQPSHGATLPPSQAISQQANVHTISKISLKTPPRTDIWRRARPGSAPDADVFNAPSLTLTLPNSKTFLRLSATFTVPYKTQFDQGGILLHWPSSQTNRWVKAGIEFFEGEPELGVVGTDRYSDWSLAPMPEGKAQTKCRMEAARDGTTLWVHVVAAGKRRALREVKWAFLDEGAGGEEMRVGVSLCSF